MNERYERLGRERKVDHQKKVTRRRLITAASITVIMSLIPPIIFGEPKTNILEFGGDSWRNAIYDFQTLITGIFAVVAALVTVLQMQKSDQRSDQRHSDAMELALRPDRLRLERGLNPHLVILRNQHRAIVNLMQVLRANKPTPDELRERFVNEQPVIKEIWEQCNAVFFNTAFREASGLFHGKLNFILEEYLKKHEQVQISVHQLGVIAGARAKKTPIDQGVYKQFVFNEGLGLFGFFSYAEEALGQIIIELGKLRESYSLA